MSWLETLSAGDEVAVFEGYGRQTARIAKVDRATACYLFVGHSKFRRKDGYSPGDSWARGRICEPLQVHRDAWDNTRLRDRIKRAAHDSTTTLDTLRKMAAALEEA